ncbi:lipid A deacylase LpxR family protein [Kangiella sp. TOML190]|uniref:lipid A deacylase LpxR family protein n=1 Tax=Kangiella sp. TOML190 TaxID=2931351 RepID=UPI00203FA8AF|nr:lipid A deacylase LpxR family protein [Kangiella sp. TOML190]
MNIKSLFLKSLLLSTFVSMLFSTSVSYADDQDDKNSKDSQINSWTSVTIDNDIIVGGDGGYTNGLMISWYDVGVSDAVGPGGLVSPLAGLVTDSPLRNSVNIYTFGQTMSTPDDIEVEEYIPDDLPYTGLLYFSNTYLVVADDFADDVSLTLGVIGPASLAKETQIAVHDITGSDDPKGWGNQSSNEIVFQLKRGRTFRNWVSENDTFDFLSRAELGIGTIDTSLAASATMRWGTSLENSFGSVPLQSSRVTNPLAFKESWYFYMEVGANYRGYSVFLDGNTFADSNSVDYNNFTYGASIGFAYSWSNWSLTVAVADRDLGNDAFDTFETDYYKYGTVTLAWRG